jgi:hypothetical protein
MADSARKAVSAIILTAGNQQQENEEEVTHTSLERVVSLGSLSGQHDTVGTVKNGVSDVRDLGTGRTGVVGHRLGSVSCVGAITKQQTHLKHLGSTDRRLSGNGALGNHHLLGHEDLTGGDLDTEITTSDHDTVRLLEDLVKVDDTLLVLDLDDNLDPGSLGSEDLTDHTDVLGGTNKRGKDHVDSVLDTECEIGLVLFGQSGEVDGGLGEIDTLARGKSTVVEGLNTELVSIDGDDLERQDSYTVSTGRKEEFKLTVIDIDELAGGGDLGDVGLRCVSIHAS